MRVPRDPGLGTVFTNQTTNILLKMTGKTESVYRMIQSHASTKNQWVTEQELFPFYDRVGTMQLPLEHIRIELNKSSPPWHVHGVLDHCKLTSAHFICERKYNGSVQYRVMPCCAGYLFAQSEEYFPFPPIVDHRPNHQPSEDQGVMPPLWDHPPGSLLGTYQGLISVVRSVTIAFNSFRETILFRIRRHEESTIQHTHVLCSASQQIQALHHTIHQLKHQHKQEHKQLRTMIQRQDQTISALRADMVRPVAEKNNVNVNVETPPTKLSLM